MRWCTYLLIYLFIQLARAYKAGNISETVEDKAKVTITINDISALILCLCFLLLLITINGLYRVVHWLLIAAKMYDLE